MSMNLQGASGLNLVVAVASAGAALTGLSGAANTYSSSLFGYLLNGTPYNKAAVSGGTTPTTDAATGLASTLGLSAINKARAYAWVVDSAGTVKVLAGREADWPNSSGTATGQPVVLEYPSIPANHVVFAVHSLAMGSNGAAFVFGSGNWNSTGLVVGTVRNCGGFLPNTPLTV